MPGLLAAVVVLGRRGLVPRGKQVGCQLRGKLSANSTTAAMSTSARVARVQKTADHLSSQPTEGAAPVRTAAAVWFTAEGRIERASKERLRELKQVSASALSNINQMPSARSKRGTREGTRHTPSDRSPFAPPTPLVPSVDPSSRGCTGSSLPSGYLAVWLPSGCTMISAPLLPSAFWGAP